MEKIDSESTIKGSPDNNTIIPESSCCKRLSSRSALVQPGLARPKRGLPEENMRHVKPRTQLHSVHANTDTDVIQNYENFEDALKILPCDTCMVQPVRSLSENLSATAESSQLSQLNEETDNIFNTYISMENSESSLHINSLPHCVLIHIFRQLSMTDRHQRAAHVCWQWHRLSQDPDLWREVNLRGLLKIDDEVLGRVVRFSKRVISLDITDCRKITDVGLENAFVVCKDLNKLILVRCQQLTERTFLSLAHNNRHLRELNLTCCFALDDTCLSLIAAKCQLLIDLTINQCSKVTDYGISELARLCPDLERLSMDHCTKLADRWVGALVDGCQHLKSLSCKGCSLTATAGMLLAKLGCLTHLDISGNANITDDVVISLVRGCQLLQSLNLSLCHLVTNDAVLHLAKYSEQLHSLNLVSCAINNEALKLLAANCPKLQTLDVAYCSEITFDAAEFVSARCPHLRYVGLMRCDKITDTEAEMLVEKFPQVHYSTMWLDCKRVLEKAREQGFIVPDKRGFCESHRAMVQSSS